jgi:starvation-inducible DNA-binding protein
MKTNTKPNDRAEDVELQRTPPQLATPTDIDPEGVALISESLNALAADALAVYVKAKNFHWHLAGVHFRDLHLLFDEQATALLASVDPLAERVRRIGGLTLRSIGHVQQLQQVQDDNDVLVAPLLMVRRLLEDHRHMISAMRSAHEVCEYWQGLEGAR